MTAPEPLKVDDKLKRQAKALQMFLARLMEPPMEAVSHSPLDVELSPREARVMFMLGEKREMIMTDLAAKLPAPLSTVTRILDRLEKKQLVERLRPDADRRVVVARLSQGGKNLHDSFLAMELQIASRMLAPLSNGEREMLLELLEKLTQSLRASGV
ncbi:MarR family transcriptional regulator [Bryobacterales bacterium F-183]|nr:MarR family transcriptional regulator [Bryobacterales bacterium F-183]